jgi:SOS-response transcriptional repressor LexA
MSQLSDILSIQNRCDYAIRITGNQLAAHHIRPGDHLIIQQATEAPEGALVVANINGVGEVIENAAGTRVLGLVIGMARRVP